MTPTWIAAFFVLGAVFGLATFRVRHQLSEGPSTPPDGEPAGAGALALWVCIASALWPVLVLSGLYALWRGQRRNH